MKNLFSASVSAARLGHDEAVLGQRDQRFAVLVVQPLGVERRGSLGQTIEQPGDSAETISCASVSVFMRNTSALLGEGDTKVEHRLLHRFETYWEEL